jgi:hypothetical protein
MDDIDQHTHVLQPSPSTYAVRSRRIAVARNCSVVVEVDAMNPRAVSVSCSPLLS